MYPDKPVASNVAVLEMLIDDDWLAEIKYDGWRALARWDGHDVILTSRHQNTIPATAHVTRALYEAVHSLPPCLLDGEWMGRRDDQPESLRLFDLLEFDGEWLGRVGAWNRWMRFTGLIEPRLVEGELVSIVPHTTTGYRDFFEYSKELPGAEGIVLKLKTSPFIGSVRRSVDNPLWLKCRHRAGSDGQLVIA